MKKHFQNKVKRRDPIAKDLLTPKYRIRIVGSGFEYKRRDKNVNDFSKQYL